MAHEDAGDKTEQPTARRREEAREEGQIARSTDLTAAAALLAALLLLKTLGPQMLARLLDLTRALGETPALTTGGLWPWMLKIGRAGAEIVGPFLLLMIVLTAAAATAQTGLYLTWKKLGFQPERLNPVAGARRMFSGDAATRLLAGLAKVGVVGWLAYTTIRGQIGTVLGAGALPTGGLFQLSLGMLFDLMLRLALALLILGLVDYFMQRWQLERQLRMTKQEVRDELKKMEGDPLIKQRRRQLAARLALQRVHADVPKADVVVANPTHYAVALRYEEATMSAPRVVAKGKDHLALRIIQIAQQHSVPVVQRPPLARALYAGVEVGADVPPAFYRAVAEVLAYVYQISGRKAG
jgi:flagellar biosynthesis protein FlhB